MNSDERKPRETSQQAPRPTPGTRETPVSPAGHTPPDQDSEPPRTADDGRDENVEGTAPPTSHPASPGSLH
jgi:hypothetical protein